MRITFKLSVLKISVYEYIISAGSDLQHINISFKDRLQNEPLKMSC